MSTLRVGLVTEGPTDQVVIKSLLERHFGAIPTAKELTFIDLQPTRDRTSGIREGGWEMVYRWCLRNTLAVRNAQYFGAGLFAGGLNALECDVIVVQLDADIAFMIGDKCQKTPPPQVGATSYELGQFIEFVIHEWLGTLEVESRDDRHIPAPTVQSVEAWLVAALTSHVNPEDLADPSLELVTWDFTRKGQAVPTTAKRIRKTPKRYSEVATHACANVHVIAQRCRWFTHLIEQLHPHVVT